MKNRAGIYTIEITLIDETRVVKIGFTMDILERFTSYGLYPANIMYISDENIRRAKEFVAGVKSDFMAYEITPGYYPIDYADIIELRLITFEKKLQDD